MPLEAPGPPVWLGQHAVFGLALRQFAARQGHSLGGPGVEDGLAAAVGAELMSSEPLEAANDLAGG